MAVVLIMLVVGMIPTCNFNWGTYEKTIPSPTPSDYMICYFKPLRNADQMALASMAVSVLLLCLAFISRVIRLHKSLSINFVAELKKAISERLRKCLRKSYVKLNIEDMPTKSLRRTMVYRPLLAAFLAMRIGADAWTSMFVEV